MCAAVPLFGIAFTLDGEPQPLPSRVCQVAFYVGLALIPVVVLGLLFWAAMHT